MGPYKPIRTNVRFRKRRGAGKLDIPRVSLGCHVNGAVPPSPDPYDKRTLIGGACKRIACQLPHIDRGLLREFRGFVRSWLHHNLKPLPADTNFDVVRWLAESKYPLWRRLQIYRKWHAVGGRIGPRQLQCSSFVKREGYYTFDKGFKEARTINSRSDAFKAYSGPVFAAIERSVYDLQPFIKHVPVADRARYVLEHVYEEGARYVSTDYTSFEAHFQPSFMRACECALYTYMLRNVENGCEIARNICVAVSGRNTLNFAGLRVTTEGCRMSGDMCTSLGNGFSNLMLMLFAAKKGGATVKGVVEGDDGLFRVKGQLDRSVFERLGFRIKIQDCDSLADARFCSMCFSPDTCLVMRDPIKSLLSTGWTFSEGRFSEKARQELLRGKARSLLCECPGVPVLTEFGRYLYRVCGMGPVRYSGVGGVKDHHEEQLDITPDRIAHSLKSCVQECDRLLVAKTYGLPVSCQLLLEDYFVHCSELQPIPFALVSGLVPENCVLYARTHVFDVKGRPQEWKR